MAECPLQFKKRDYQLFYFEMERWFNFKTSRKYQVFRIHPASGGRQLEKTLILLLLTCNLLLSERWGEVPQLI
jgi:hypothetical protein